MDHNHQLIHQLFGRNGQQLSVISRKSHLCHDDDSVAHDKSIKINDINDNNDNNSNNNSNNNQSHSTKCSLTKDYFCWDCHKDTIDFSCVACPRSYHQKCPSLKNKSRDDPFIATNKGLCPECEDIMKAEEGSNPLGCMSWLGGNVDDLAKILRFTIITVKAADRNKRFSKSVSVKDFPEYEKLIVNPMDLSVIEKNVKNRTYGSTKSFLADVKWIYHNCVIFNSGSNSVYIHESKNIIRVAKQECEEIEICPDCYLNYYSMKEKDYFAATCRRPHAIVWAKLSGHPYWPAKVVRHDKQKNLIDVRFFGTHDKCWLKPENCYFMSKEYPYNKKPSKFDETKFNQAIRDMNSHLDQLEEKHPGLFKFHEKNTYFINDELYLTKDKKSHNGVRLKNLKVNPTKFDLSAIKLLNADQQLDKSDSPSKKFKSSNSSDSLNSLSNLSTDQCFAKSSNIGQSTSCQTDKSVNDEKTDSEMEPNSNSDESRVNKNLSNQLEEGCDENDSSENSVKSNHLRLTHLKTVTVSGKSSEILHINRSNKFIHNIPSNHKSVEIQTTSGSKTPIESNVNRKSKSQMSIESIRNSIRKEFESKIKSLEIEYNRLLVKKNEIEDDREEFRQRCEELERSIDEVKRKQWCSYCLKEAILPCCWNTCYCTVECQHKHWPVHAKICRRKQMTSQLTNKS